MYAELMRKVCNKCKIEKPSSEFSKKRGQLNSRCKGCIKEYMHSLYMQNRDVERAKRKKYYEENKEAYKANVRRNYKENKDRISISRACRRRGITVEQYKILFEKQKGVCAVCKNRNNKKNLSIDHCHVTNKVRGLLCDNCNTALGLFKEDPCRMQEALIYLNKHKKLG